MNKIILFLIGFGVIAIVIYGLFNSVVKNKSVKPAILIQTQPLAVINIPKNVDYSAGFAIFTNGTFRMFSAAMYHNLSLDVYIQSDNPSIVHVKKSGTKWDDFFKTLPFKLTKDCLTTGTKQTFCTDTNGKLRFYLNGKEDANALDKQIENGDQLLVTYGNENKDQIQTQLQKVPSLK